MKDLNKMFKPESVAVIGASNTPGKVGYIIVDNLINDGFKGEIYPVNPKGGEILGKKAYKNITEIPGDVGNHPHPHAVDLLFAGLGGLETPAAIEIVRLIAAERSLVQPVVNHGSRAEIITGPVVDRYPAFQDRGKAHSGRNCQSCFQKSASLHNWRRVF